MKILEGKPVSERISITFEERIKNLKKTPNIAVLGIRGDNAGEAYISRIKRNCEKYGIGFLLNLAETGHLVFSTLHTNSATHTLNRYLSFYPSDMQNSVLERMADCLVGIMSQTLIKTKDAQWRIWIFELMLNSNAVKNNLKKREVDQMQNIIETSTQNWMISMRQYAKKLLERDIINQEDVEWLLNSKSSSQV